jgi:hypothetical protein
LVSAYEDKCSKASVAQEKDHENAQEYWQNLG